MIRFLGREIMGWFLVLVGLGIFYLCVALLLNAGAEFILEGPVLAMIGIIVFRGGIHLLKVAVAARVAMQTKPDGQNAPPVAKRATKAESPWDW